MVSTLPVAVDHELGQGVESVMQEEQVKSENGGTGITYSMDYPVIIATGVVVPKVYKGKPGMPSTSKPKLRIKIMYKNTYRGRLPILVASSISLRDANTCFGHIEIREVAASIF